MLRSLLPATCVALTLAGCIYTPHHRTTKAVNTALTGACLAARLYPCTIEPSEADKSHAVEAKASATRATVQRESTAADREVASRSSCLTDDGPRLPVSASQCANYGPVASSSSTRD